MPSILNLLPCATKPPKQIHLDGHRDTVDRLVSVRRFLTHAEADWDSLRASFLPTVQTAWFDRNAGKAAPCPTVRLVGNLGTLDVSFQSRWSDKNIPPQMPADMLRDRFSITIKGDDIPAGVAEDFVRELLALAEKHGVPIQAKGARYPVPAFNELRHVRFSSAQNMALEAAGLGTVAAWKQESEGSK